jgi:alkyldihydroxyacetonephosphate synthase
MLCGKISDFSGTLGVVTEVIIKVRPIPDVQNFASYVFSEFDTGVEFMREVALKVRPR